MGLVINSQSVNKNWTYTEDEWKLIGNSVHNEQGWANFNCEIRKVETIEGEQQETYIGSANGYKNGVEPKINISDVPIRDIAEVSQAVEDLVTALDAE